MLALVGIVVALIRIQGEVMKDPEWWERIPWVGITCLAIAIASLIALILTW